MDGDSYNDCSLQYYEALTVQFKNTQRYYNNK